MADSCWRGPSWIDPVPLIKPRRLKEGSVVAVVSPSLAGPYVFPRVYEHALSVLKEELGLEVVEMEHTRKPNYYIRLNPHLRAQDINDAFNDPGIDAVLATIGGDDSMRVLPYLRTKEILKRPKVLMGFSDTTTLLSYFSYKGMVTFNGPSLMAGICQIRHYPKQLQHIRDMLFDPRPEYTYQPSKYYSEGYPDWSCDDAIGRISKKKRAPKWKVLQGEDKVTGTLFGGCIEVMEIMKGSPYWPPHYFWTDKVMLMEASEQMVSPIAMKQILRNYGTMEVFENISALLFGRWRGYTYQQRLEVERIIKKVVAEEFGRPDLPIIMNMDFGHTDPQMILPLGVRAEVDPSVPSLTLKEPPLL